MKKILLVVSIFLIAVVLLINKPVNAAKSSCKTIQSGTLQNSYGDTLSTGYDKWGYNYQASIFNGKYCDAYHNDAWCQQFKDINLQMNWNNAWLSNQSCDGDNLLDRHYGFSSYVNSGAWLTNHATGTYTSAKSYHWNLDGVWGLNFNSTLYPSGNPYAHSLTITGTTATGSSTGNTYNATVTTVNDNVTIVASYLPGSAAYPYTYTANGTITASGLTGTWTDTLGDSGTWSSTSGTALKVFDICTVSDFVKIVAVPTGATQYTDLTKCPAQTGYDGMVWKDENGHDIGCSIWGEFAVIQEQSSDPCGEYGTINYISPMRKGLGNWSK